MRIHWLNNGLQITGNDQELKVLAAIYYNLMILECIDLGPDPDRSVGDGRMHSLTESSEQSL